MNGSLLPAGPPIKARINAIIASHPTDLADAIVKELGLTVETAEFATKLGLPGRRRWATPWERTTPEEDANE